MRTRIGKRKSTGTEDDNASPKKQRQQYGDNGAGDDETQTKSGIELLTTTCYRRLAHYLDDYDIDALAMCSKTMRTHLEVNGIWRARFERLFDRDDDEKLAIASNWQQLYKWQRASISYTDGRAFDEHLDHKIYMDTGMYGIKKVIPTRDVLFVLDHSGAVHKYETDTDEWVHGILWNVVDIVTDASDHQHQRNSLFVLSQSDSLRAERPRLIDFHRWEQVKDDVYLPSTLFDFEKKLRHWQPTGAPRSGDKVDVFRIEDGDLRRVFKMTFQQAHRFTHLQVSNRDYTMSEAQSRSSDSRGKHINELQLLTTKGRVWSLTVNEPELIAQGGGAQVALKNITSRFDRFFADANDQCQVRRLFNGKHISAMLEKGGDLLVFSDQNEEMETMFPELKLFDTKIGKHSDSKRLSTVINIGCEIVDCAISKNHILLIDCRGRLWSLGRNRNGQLGLCSRADQSKAKLVPLPLDVKYVVSADVTNNQSVIVAEMKNGQRQAFGCGALKGTKFCNMDIDCNDQFLFVNGSG